MNGDFVPRAGAVFAGPLAGEDSLRTSVDGVVRRGILENAGDFRVREGRRKAQDQWEVR